jgi:thiamine pyrophosphokinase
MKVLIFANGEMGEIDDLSQLIDSTDLVIAADGGANICSGLGLIPDTLVGDFDSIKQEVLEVYEKKGVEILRHSPRKDATDLELALEHAVDRGAERVWLLGALGGRWDMSLANIMLAAADRFKDIKVSLVNQDCSMHILQPGRSHSIIGFSGQNVSLIPLQGDVYGVTLTGFEYLLNSQPIKLGSSLGVSNVMVAEQASVQHSRGVLLCLQENVKR